MRIESLDILTAGTTWRNLIVVKLTTDDGLVGLGEATIEYGDRALMAYLPEIFQRAVKGRDPRDIPALLAAMVKADYWRSGFIARTAFSAIELACWDIKARHEHMPVLRLFESDRDQPLPVYANGWYRTSRDPQLVAEAAAAVVEQGYRAMKIDPFGTGDESLSRDEADRSLAIVREVRDAVGDEVEIYIEGHGRFDLGTSVQLAKAMEPYRPGFFEEPLIPELNGLLPKLIEQTSVPIALGERLSSPEMFEPLALCPRLVLQPDLCHVGGIQAAMRVAEMAASRGWQLAPHNAGGPLATTHAMHFGLAHQQVMVQEVFDDFEADWVREAFTGRATVQAGCSAVSEEPGFGVDIREDILVRHPFVDRHLDLFTEGWEQRSAEAMK